MKEITAIFGGGGIWGVAWMTGVAMGLADHGIDVGQARAFLGTSAGSGCRQPDRLRGFRRHVSSTGRPIPPNSRANHCRQGRRA